MKTILVNVPPWYPNQPYLSIPLLTGILRNAGYEVYQQDINLSFFNTLLSEKELITQFSLVDPYLLNQKEKHLLTLKHYFINNVSNLKVKIRDINSYRNLKELKEVFEDIDLILKTYQLNFKNIDIRLGQLEYNFEYFKPENILSYINCENNLFTYYFKKYELGVLEKISPTIFGISITTPEQLIPALSFAKIIKHYLPTIKILLGGDYISRIHNNFIKYEPLNELFDFILIGEAEESIKYLFDTIRTGKDFDGVPNLIWKNKNGEIVTNKKNEMTKFNNYVYPDFDGLELNHYFAPNFVVPIEVSKACYWGKCTFCEVAGKQYFQKSAQNLIEEIKYLSIKYRTKYFTFVSSAPSPKLLKKISLIMIQQGIEIVWTVMLRPENYIDSEFAKLLYNGGMRVAMLGIESGNQEILNSMEKGLSINENEIIIRTLNSVGVFVHAYFMFNYKFETEKQKHDTIDFINGNSKSINSISISNYVEPSFGENDLNDFNIYSENSNNTDIKEIDLSIYENQNYFFHINTYLIINYENEYDYSA